MMTEFLRKEESGAAGNGRRSTVGAETTLKRTGAVKIQKSSNLTILTAILALVVVFGACKKDDMGMKNIKIKGEAALAEEFDKNAEYFCGNSLFGGQTINSVRVKFGLESGSPVPGVTTPLGDGFHLNPWFDNFQVKNMTSGSDQYGRVYNSFCSHYYSSQTGGYGNESHRYAVKTSEFIQLKGFKTYANIIRAFNYIYDTWGSIDVWPTEATDDPTQATKLIANLVIWQLTGDGVNFIEIEDVRFAGLNMYIAEVFANYKTYEPEVAYVVDFEFLADPSYTAENAWNAISRCQPQIVPLREDGFFLSDGSINFTKMKLVNDEEEPADFEEFAFDLYEVDANWANPVFLYTCYTGLMGVSSGQLPTGNYVFIEKEINGWKLDLPEGIDGLYFSIDAVKGTSAWRDNFMFENVSTVVNKPTEEPPVLGPGYGSVTATNVWYKEVSGNMVVPNANHFTFAKLCWKELTQGKTIELAMVVGNKIDRVGTCYVTKDGNNLVIEIENFGKGEFGAVAFNKMVAPKNGNIHSGQWDPKACGALVGKFNHDNKLTIPCPSPDGSNNFIYLYIHCGSINYWQIPMEPREDVVYSNGVKNGTVSGGGNNGQNNPPAATPATLNYVVEKNYDVTATVTVNGTSATKTITYAKNTTKTETINGKTVVVEFKNNDVKSVKLQ